MTHKKCDGSKDCVVYRNALPMDLQFHNFSEHCAICAVFWNKRHRNKCLTKPPKKGGS